VSQRPACGRPLEQRCKATCDPCADAIMVRADELARLELAAQGRAA
jgi:hypothetical protein